MRNDFLLVRHSYDDHSYIDGKNDTSLTKNGIEIAKNASKELVKKIDSDQVIIRHSLKKRAKETAEIFENYFTSIGIKCNVIADNGLTELYQGQFNFENMLHEERVKFLEDCWKDFEKCRLNGDFYHNFGQNMNNQVMIKLGENHLEWSLKVANGLLNIITDMKNSYQTISIAHRAVIYEIEQLVKLANSLIDMKNVEMYQTRWMNYCSIYNLKFDDVIQAETIIKKYKLIRGNNENNN